MINCVMVMSLLSSAPSFSVCSIMLFRWACLQHGWFFDWLRIVNFMFDCFTCDCFWLYFSCWYV